MRILTGALAALLALGAAWPAAAQPLLQPEQATGSQPKAAVHARRFMVAAANPFAVDAGVQALRRGGSVVDAAIAVQMVLGLVEPQSSGIGGGAFLLHWARAEKRLRGYDGRETAPAAARSDRFLDASGKPLDPPAAIANGRAVGVPGVLRMLEAAHRRHGRIAWAKLFDSAIRLAEQGFPMSPRLYQLLQAESTLRGDAAARALYYGSDGGPRPVGALVFNREYAATLRAVATFGADAFYTGVIAEDLARAVAAHRRPGDLTPEDLLRYRAIEREPVCGDYRGRRICSIGPPAGGVTLLQLLGILERTPFHRAAPGSVDALHLFSEAARLAYADRARYLADPAFVRQPVAGLLEFDYLESRAALIGERSMRRAAPGTPRGAPAMLGDSAAAEPAGTSHISIVDARGDAVAMTTTIESAFGSRIMVRGFLLNNELTDFSPLPGNGARAGRSDTRVAANRVEPGKRPRSAMSPTFVFGRDGQLQAVLGSPGGPAIITFVAKALVAMLDWGMDAQSAVALPNFGSRNGPTEIERGSAYEALAPALRERGHEVLLVDLASGTHVIERVEGGWRGGADPRREGVARGD
ncbi:MAG: gamma-glutamyltransferase [Betaproteobacteria bacterium RBG_16_66_20]|nr:MAG: gamma-glutamyltransferase [Betaproteobacteria bacterium RBG_16_66_20]